jgi:hypothetical protein
MVSPAPSPQPGPQPGPAVHPSHPAPPNQLPTGATAAADQQLDETIKQVSNNYQDTFPRLVDNPLATKKQSEDILASDLAWLRQIAPLTAQKPDLATDLSQAYLQIALAQWNSARHSLDDRDGSLETCETGLRVLASLPEESAQSDKVKAIADSLNQQRNQLLASRS